MATSKVKHVGFKLDKELLAKIDERARLLGFQDRSKYMIGLVEKDLADDTELPSTTNRLLVDLNYQMKDIRMQFESAFALSYKEGGPPSKYEKLKFAIKHFAAASLGKEPARLEHFEKNWNKIFEGEFPKKE